MRRHGGEVRVLRQGVDRGPAGPRSVTELAANAGPTLIDGHGAIVDEFFDVGQSRSIPWKRRPEAARLLATVKAPDRSFDAMVLGSRSGRSTATSTG